MRRAAVLVGLLLVACGKDQPPPVDEGPAPGTREWKLAMARSAAPWEVSLGAQVVELPSGDSAQPVELAAGTTGWTCLVDVLESPAPDPMCADSTFMEWVNAWQARRPPAIRAMGVAYMLQGGQGASDTDPFKATPDSGQPWMADPPHVMIVMPNPRTSFAGLPTTRTVNGPWVMFAGTPYAHIMMPVSAAAR